MRHRILASLASVTLLVAPPVFGEAELEPEYTVTEESPVDTPETVRAEQAPIPAAPESEATEARVARATFTTDVMDREPRDSITTLGNDHPRVFYFSEILGMGGRSVTHRWEHAGKVEAEVELKIGGPRWRVFSSKSLEPGWLGEWTVTLLDDSNQVLRRDQFTYTAIQEEIDPSVPAAPSPQP